jgi:AcrR family transcriptional regulator
MVKGQKPVARVRNVDRSAATRLKLLNATVECLVKAGYAATTTTLVCEAAKVTRGGLLHHFPSKVDLMVGAARHCIERMEAERRDRRPDEPDLVGGVDRAQVLMDILLEPQGVALTELIIGARSDPDLAARFTAIGELLEQNQLRAASNLSARWNVEIRRVRAMVYLHMAALRGMAIMSMADMDGGATEDALALLREYRGYVRSGGAEEEGERNRPKV